MTTESVVPHPVDRVLEQGERIAAALRDLAAAHGDQVVDLTLAAARVDAISQVFGPVIGVIVTGAILAVSYVLRKSVKTWLNGDEIVLGIYLTTVVCSGVGFLIALTQTVNIWAWAGAYDPRLWLAAKVLGMV
jgi:hypothetical protein